MFTYHNDKNTHLEPHRSCIHHRHHLRNHYCPVGCAYHVFHGRNRYITGHAHLLKHVVIAERLHCKPLFDQCLNLSKERTRSLDMNSINRKMYHTYRKNIYTNYSKLILINFFSMLTLKPLLFKLVSKL